MYSGYCENCFNNNLKIILPTLRQQDDEWNYRINICQKLQQLLDEWMPQFKLSVHIYGSTLSGLCLNNSDLDLGLLTQYPSDSIILRIVSEILINNDFDKVQLIETARVPVIKFRDKVSRIHCDVSLNQLSGLYNSEYYLQATKINPLLVHVTLALKHWAKCRKLNDPFHGTFASCAITTLIIYYFQHTTPPIFPKTLIYTIDKQLKPVFFCEESQMSKSLLSQHSVGSLIYGFFKYYKHFDFNQTISLLPIDDITFSQFSTITVIDPTNITNNLTRVVSFEGLTKFEKEIERACNLIETTSNFEKVVEKIDL
ncbi:Poly(A) RNA polymerase cid11 [Entamoeba marina]